VGLEVFVLVGVVAGAAPMMMGTMDLGDDLLARTPFTTWFGPGLALALCVGIPMAVALVVALRWPRRWWLPALGAGVVLVGWLALQPLVLRVVHPLTVVMGVVAVTLATLAVLEARRSITRATCLANVDERGCSTGPG